MSEEEFQVILGNQRRANEAGALAESGIAKLLKRNDRIIAKSEAELEQTCTNILTQDGWRYLKTDPVSRRAHGKGFGELGMADGLYIRYSVGRWPETPADDICATSHAQIMWIEWKRRTETGADTKAAEHQKAWHRDERAKGALTLIAGEDFPATIEGFCDWYQRSGLMRTK